jgi:multisubunit Na+/H+ antiporter MnhB subunit
MKSVLLFVCLLVLGSVFLYVFLSPGFGIWERKGLADYYLENALEKTGSANLVSSIVWDFRGFDTLGEETVLFTAAVGVFTIVIFGMKRRK